MNRFLQLASLSYKQLPRVTKRKIDVLVFKTAKRLFQNDIRVGAATNVSLNKNSSSKVEVKENKKKDDPHLFFDNLGKIFLGFIGGIIVWLIRSSRGMTNRTTLRQKLEDESILDPCEIDDLRIANSEFTPEVYFKLLQTIRQNFPTGEATYADFLSTLLKVMRDMKGEEFTIEFGHLLDRIIFSRETKKVEKVFSINFLLVCLSLALNSPVDKRIQLLFQSMLPPESSTSSLVNDQMHTGEVINSLSFEEIVQIVENLQLSCQLVPDAQIVASKVKYPFQQYYQGSSEELVLLANKELNDRFEIHLDQDSRYSLKHFDYLLKTSYICAWGECYCKRNISK